MRFFCQLLIRLETFTLVVLDLGVARPACLSTVGRNPRSVRPFSDAPWHVSSILLGGSLVYYKKKSSRIDRVARINSQLWYSVTYHIKSVLLTTNAIRLKRAVLCFNSIKIFQKHSKSVDILFQANLECSLSPAMRWRPQRVWLIVISPVHSARERILLRNFK